MQLLQAFEDSAHVVVGVVHHLDGRFHRSQCVLREIDGLRRVPVLEYLGDSLHRFVHIRRVVVGLTIVDVVAWVD